MATSASEPSPSDNSGLGSQSPADARLSPAPFKAFWKRSESSKSPQDVTFVQQDPSNVSKKKTSRFSRWLKSGRKDESSEDGTPPDSSLTEAQKRRQQVYQAQKRHRNRKAEYVTSLEAEVAKLQHMDSLLNSEKEALMHQNQAIKALLASHSLDAQFEQLVFNSQPPSNDSASPRGGAFVSVRNDPYIGHERTFLDFDDMQDIVWTSSDASKSESDGTVQKLPADRTPVNGDSAAALDFILALEWCCQGHTNHEAIYPASGPSCASEDGHGHALTTTNAVFQRALPQTESTFSQNQGALPKKSQSQSEKERWHLPHSEIDKLVRLSENLPIDDDLITPAQAYAAIRGAVPNEESLRPTLDAMKLPLSGLVGCQGFGAWMPTDLFWEHLDTALQNQPSPNPPVQNFHP